MKNVIIRIGVCQAQVAKMTDDIELHFVFLGDMKEGKDVKRKEFFQMKCYSYDRKDLNKHFKRMTQLFFILGADINLKQEQGHKQSSRV